MFDRCCYFEPGVWNNIYCRRCRCKRLAENVVKRLTKSEEELWQLQESRKEDRATAAQNKNEWLLQNKTFGFVDLECTSLQASIGEILCGCIKLLNGDIQTFVGDRRGDKKVCVQIRDALERLDYVCTFYGTGFDLPFLNTRLVAQGERPIDQLRHIDLYYVARNKLKLHSNRLQVVAETLFGKSEKTRVIGPIWLQASRGDKAAMNYIVEHCQRDVSELESLFLQLRGFINIGATRIRRFGASY